MSSRAPYFLIATFPLVASLVVLSFADVSRNVWLMHVLLLGLTALLIVAGQFLDRWPQHSRPNALITLLTLVGLAVTLLDQSAGPRRWISWGPVNLYIAPVLLPSFLAACSVSLRQRGGQQVGTFTVLVAASVLLAWQPDASQVAALLAASAVLFVRYRPNGFSSISTLIVIALITAWAFTRPDPLAPVPYVEGVFALALSHSLLAGVAVIASAFVFLAGFCVYARRSAAWLDAVAAYYAALFVCSVAGLTPAPLIGYGAGPWLGFGFLAAVSGWIDPAALPNKPGKLPPPDLAA